MIVGTYFGIFKESKKSEPANYKPVTLTSVTYRVLEHVYNIQS